MCTWEEEVSGSMGGGGGDAYVCDGGDGVSKCI